MDWRRISFIFLFGTTCGSSFPAEATEQHSLVAQIQSLQTNLDHVWILTTGGLIFLMQIGFMLVESGLVRSKNSINVAQKNLADFALSLTCFGAFGFMIMFGPSIMGLFGFDMSLIAFDQVDDRTYSLFLFQAFFCGTAATIMSGITAERMKLSAYLLIIPVIAIIIYPVFGHWVWGGLLYENNTAFLADRGFVDFAGSTVVHSVGAWVGLAALIIIGPRLGRYDAHGRPVQIQGHSIVLATVGVFLLWIGWMGFNGGSTLTGSGQVSSIVANTMIAGALGAVAGLIYGCFRDDVFRPTRMMNGILGGLVAVTAGCDLVSTWGAVALGLSGSWIALFGEDQLEKRGFDDAVGAISVHGFAGAWGTIAVALIAPLDSLPLANRLDQLFVQIGGVAIAFVWAFGTAFLAFKIIDRLIGIRISPIDEIAGLNESEHGATLGTGELQTLLANLLSGNAKLSDRLYIEPGDEASELAALFNEHMSNLEVEQTRQLHAERRHANALQLALDKEKKLNELQRSFVSMTSHEFRTPLAIIDGNVRRLERRIGKLTPDDVAGRLKTIKGAIKRMTALMESTLSAAKMDAGDIKVTPEKVDLRSILVECCRVQEELSHGHKIVIKDGDLSDEVTADPTSLRQIFTNLLSNATKYSPDSDRVDVEVRQAGDDIFVTVRDYGLGIAEDDLPKLCDRYFRGQTITGIPGTGIGLSLLKMLLDAHDGSMTIKSAVGEGSEFTIRIPRLGPISKVAQAA